MKYMRSATTCHPAPKSISFLGGDIHGGVCSSVPDTNPRGVGGGGGGPEGGGQNFFPFWGHF